MCEENFSWLSRTFFHLGSWQLPIPTVFPQCSHRPALRCPAHAFEAPGFCCCRDLIACNVGASTGILQLHFRHIPTHSFKVCSAVRLNPLRYMRLLLLQSRYLLLQTCSSQAKQIIPESIVGSWKNLGAVRWFSAFCWTKCRLTSSFRVPRWKQKHSQHCAQWHSKLVLTFFDASFYHRLPLQDKLYASVCFTASNVLQTLNISNHSLLEFLQLSLVVFLAFRTKQEFCSLKRDLSISSYNLWSLRLNASFVSAKTLNLLRELLLQILIHTALSPALTTKFKTAKSGPLRF